MFRYVSSMGGDEAPEVMVSTAAGAGVELITEDRTSNTVLRAPGDAVVVRAEFDSSIMVAIMPSPSAGNRDAHFVFEHVTQSSPVAPTVRGYVAAPVSTAEVSNPAILAHVSRRGDVLVAGGEWVCGPQLPMAIEGLQLSWPDRPRDVDIVVGAVINAGGRRTLAPATSGNFVGTRGKAAPIVGLTLALVGPAAHAYRLSCEALFFGSQVQVQEGVSLDFSGASGFEPLVGVRVTVKSAQAQPSQARSSHFSAAAAPMAAPALVAADVRPSHIAPAVPVADPKLVEPPAAPVAPVDASSPVRKAGRVRVFRASKPGPLSPSLN